MVDLGKKAAAGDVPSQMKLRLHMQQAAGTSAVEPKKETEPELVDPNETIVYKPWPGAEDTVYRADSSFDMRAVREDLLVASSAAVCEEINSPDETRGIMAGRAVVTGIPGTQEGAPTGGGVRGFPGWCYNCNARTDHSNAEWCRRNNGRRLNWRDYRRVGGYKNFRVDQDLRMTDAQAAQARDRRDRMEHRINEDSLEAVRALGIQNRRQAEDLATQARRQSEDLVEAQRAMGISNRRRAEDKDDEERWARQDRHREAMERQLIWDYRKYHY